MKAQSSIEFYILLAVAVIATIAFSFFLLKEYSANISSERNITINNINILNFNLYFSPSSNAIVGSFYQNGGKIFSTGALQLKLNNSVYSIPVSFSYSNSTIFTYNIDFKSNTLSGNVLNSIYVGEPYTLIGIIFQNSSKSDIYYDNYSSVIYSQQ